MTPMINYQYRIGELNFSDTLRALYNARKSHMTLSRSSNKDISMVEGLTHEIRGNDELIICNAIPDQNKLLRDLHSLGELLID
jgi:hypothetical protein